MPKKQADDSAAELKKLMKSGSLVIGTERTIKGLKEGKLQKVYVSSNCPAGVRGDIAYYSKIYPVEVVELHQPNDELGVLCKKQFAISVIGLPKEGKA